MRLTFLKQKIFFFSQGFGMAAIAPLVAMAGFLMLYNMKSGDEVKKKVQSLIDQKENELARDKIGDLLATPSICRQNFLNQFAAVTTTRSTLNLSEIDVNTAVFKSAYKINSFTFTDFVPLTSSFPEVNSAAYSYSYVKNNLKINFTIGKMAQTKSISIVSLVNRSNNAIYDCMTETAFLKMINNCQELTGSIRSLATNVFGCVHLNNADPASLNHQISLTAYAQSLSDQITALQTQIDNLRNFVNTL
jgi:hypothetical protein